MGAAAPMLVLGAMTAKLAAAVMKVPAEAARAPGGDTYTAVGTLSLNRSSVIFWVELRRPPGVSSFMITTSAPSFSPLSMTLEMNRCVTGLMAPSTSASRPCLSCPNADPAAPSPTMIAESSRRVARKGRDLVIPITSLYCACSVAG